MEKVKWTEDMKYASMGKIYGQLVLEKLRYLPPEANIYEVRPVPKKYRVATRAWLDYYYEEIAKTLEKYEVDEEDEEVLPSRKPQSVHTEEDE